MKTKMRSYIFFCTTCNFLHIPRYVWCACCCWCTEPSGTWREGPWIKMLWCCDIDSSIIIIYSICQLNWLTWHSLRSDLIWAEESWTSLVRSLNTPTSMRTQCQAQSSMNSWDMLLLQSTTRQRLHYLLIDDVVAQDADGILQFLVASPPPPPVVAGHHFREDLTHGVVRLLQRSRLGVQTKTKVSHR